MARSEDRSAAILTVKRPDLMTKAGHGMIARWLRRQADFIEQHGYELAPGFRARYLYAVVDKKTLNKLKRRAKARAKKS